MDPSKRVLPRQRNPRHAGEGRYRREAMVTDRQAIKESSRAVIGRDDSTSRPNVTAGGDQ